MSGQFWSSIINIMQYHAISALYWNSWTFKVTAYLCQVPTVCSLEGSSKFAWQPVYFVSLRTTLTLPTADQALPPVCYTHGRANLNDCSIHVLHLMIHCHVSQMSARYIQGWSHLLIIFWFTVQVATILVRTIVLSLVWYSSKECLELAKPYSFFLSN